MQSSNSKYHKTLAAFFHKSRFGLRKVRELPWQLIASGETEQLASIYCDLPFFHMAWRIDRFETKKFWNILENNADFKLTSTYAPIINNPSEALISYYEDIVNLFSETFHIQEIIPLLEFQVQYFRRKKYNFHLLQCVSQYAYALKENGMFEPSLTAYREAEQLAENSGDIPEYCSALANQSAIFILQSKFNISISFLNKQEILSRKNNDRYNLTLCLINQSVVRRNCGLSEMAQKVLSEAADIAKEIDRELLTICDFNMGVFLFDSGLYDDAEVKFNTSLEKFILVGNIKQIAATNGNLAVIAIQKGEYSKALEYLNRQETICTSSNEQVMFQACLCNKALFLIINHDFEKALELLVRAEKIARSLAMTEGICKSLICQGLIFLRSAGQSRKGKILLNEAKYLANENGLLLIEKEIDTVLNTEYSQGSISGWMLPIVLMSNLSFIRKPAPVFIESSHIIPDWSLMNEEEILTFIKKGGDPLITDKDGGTSLMASASMGAYDVSKLLLDLQVDVNAVDNNGTTALMVAAKRGYNSIIRLLVESGAKINHRNVYGFTSLLFAIQSGKVDLVKTLLKNGADPNLGTSQGITPIHMAAFHCNTIIAAELMLYGADPFKKTVDGLTALSIAEEKCTELYNYLLSQIK